jgi:hypothetical protein
MSGKRVTHNWLQSSSLWLRIKKRGATALCAEENELHLEWGGAVLSMTSNFATEHQQCFCCNVGAARHVHMAYGYERDSMT